MSAPSCPFVPAKSCYNEELVVPSEVEIAVRSTVTEMLLAHSPPRFVPSARTKRTCAGATTSRVGRSCLGRILLPLPPLSPHPSCTVTANLSREREEPQPRYRPETSQEASLAQGWPSTELLLPNVCSPRVNVVSRAPEGESPSLLAHPAVSLPFNGNWVGAKRAADEEGSTERPDALWSRQSSDGKIARAKN